MRILIIEDDVRIALNLKSILSRQSYAVDTAFTAADGRTKLSDEEYDLLVLDWMLPDSDGPTICTWLRDEKKSIPILMLTARSMLDDTVEGLNAGCDDYLTKPFEMEELLARVRALLRRAPTSPVSPTIKIRDLTIDTNNHTVTRGNTVITLSPKEFALLLYLAINAGKALDRIAILTHAWDEQADLFSNTVDVHIRYLRKKIDDPFSSKIIKTVKGKGYMLCAD